MSQLVCHYCGSLVPLKGLQSHQVQCSSEWHKRQKQLIPELQRAYPPRDVPNMLIPSSETDTKAIEKYNSFAKVLYLQESLNPCPSCLRLFPAKEMGAHFISCNNTPQKEGSSHAMKEPQRSISPEKQKNSPDRSKEQLEASPRLKVEKKHTAHPSTTTSSAQNTSQLEPFMPTRESSVSASQEKRKAPIRDLNGRPIAYCCHLCGREYLNVGSLTFHIPNCLEKRTASQNELPREYRTKAPHAPRVPIPEDRLAEDFLNRLEEYNQAAYRIYEQSSRVPCKFCGRRFNPDSLMVHVKACAKVHEATQNTPPSFSTSSNLQSGGPVTNANEIPVGGIKSKSAAYRALSAGKYVEIERAECSKCGRKFALDRLPVHESSCKGIGLKKENNPPASKILTERIKNFGVEDMKTKSESVSVPTSNQQPNTRLSTTVATMRQSMEQDTRVQCPCCNRKFNPDRIEKHVSICKARIY
ncbi:hypothetical protein C9374_014468 [Naegleria lovaniensis]|uniref:C2HC/C3H-type domain-containing protein n=1 Tax=Naegleria lovaniensis TaxID=51637 RepID=A0AA88H0Y1_NAELO|nr:uncharacterized protein C9374_014468 [Naegleria lovaniensis]KAG2389068.1 hypothetical protein C9374_014468 [Naegleria lovaniensis]